MKKIGMLVAAVGLFCGAPLSIEWSPTSGPALSVDSAQARVGRPATPGSVAGVARRTTRRTVRRGVVVAPVRRAIIYCTAVGYPVGCVPR
ncbi:hypothetical protein RHPLAN_63760 [Rhodoplanes sp. Z2-YC6860]|nr:hypothetical protein RHPLAN_63760 [Rhodoplanes sp. Z2-YC6860]